MSECRLQEPLSDEIRKATVGRGGVRVVLHREPKVTVRLLAGELDDVLARAQELDHGQREIREPAGIRLAALSEEGFERLRAGSRGQVSPEACGQLDEAPPPLGGA